MLNPQRDPFETPEEFQARLQRLLKHFNRGARQHDPHYQAGAATLQQKGYDIASGRFPFNVDWTDWADLLFKPFGWWIKSNVNEAKTLLQEYGQLGRKPVFLTLRLTNTGCVAESAALIGIGMEWELPRPRVETVKTIKNIEYIVKGIRFEFATIPGGAFLMGSPDGQGNDFERPQHHVTIQPFYMGIYPVTQAQWRAVMNNNPSKFNGDERPVEQVSWNDCQKFIKKLNTCIETDGCASLPEGMRFRLPTEAEWEYACRAGTQSEHWFGDVKYEGMFRHHTPKFVGTYPVGHDMANAFGLHDMFGNVYELCADASHDTYQGAPADGNAWGRKLNKHKQRVIRGGVFSFCRCAERSGFGDDDERREFVGFRLVASTR